MRVVGWVWLNSYGGTMWGLRGPITRVTREGAPGRDRAPLLKGKGLRLSLISLEMQR